MGRKFFDRIKGNRVLVAPLDWGLGHATRCVPIINALLDAGKEVTIAASNAPATLLGTEFPALRQLSLPGYNIKYHHRSPATGLIFQLPRISRTIVQEHNCLEAILEQEKFDCVISDNRYGLYNRKVHSVFITHQLQIQSPWGSWTNRLSRYWHYRKIQKFNECWVPDLAEPPGLAGELSHPRIMPKIHVEYLGPLSRFKVDAPGTVYPINNHILVILSGPEPHRGYLEDKVIDQLVHYNGTATVVRGLPNSETHIADTNHITFHNHLSAELLFKEICKASLVIARCGYSTVMDMFILKKNCLLIPTPGQTEQEYLAKHLNKYRLMKCVDEKDLDISRLNFITDGQKVN